MNAIKAQRQADDKKGDFSFDFKFNTTLLNASVDVLSNPKNEAYRDVLNRYMQLNVNGRPSTLKKVLGAILMFLGAAAAIASLAVGFATIGIASPFAIAGMAGGATLFAVGTGLLIHGRTKGIEKSLQNLDSAARQPKLNVKLFPEGEALRPPVRDENEPVVAEDLKPTSPPLGK
jgi:hypothetical protein